MRVGAVNASSCGRYVRGPSASPGLRQQETELRGAAGRCSDELGQPELLA